jgi:hypothetical protein
MLLEKIILTLSWRHQLNTKCILWKNMWRISRFLCHKICDVLHQYTTFFNVFWIYRNMKFLHYVYVTCFNGLVGWKPLWGQCCYVWWGLYPSLCPLPGLILFPWFCVIVLALPVTRIIFVFFPSQRLLRRLVEATQRSVP